MLEAHVQFELRRFNADNLRATLEEEIAALFVWFDQVKLQEVVHAAQVTELITRNVVELPLSAEIVDFIQENAIIVLEFLQEDKTRVEEILPRPIFDQATATIGNLETLRRAIIHQVVSSSAYSMLIAHVLYHGIKGYVLAENTLTRNVPGLSSFVKLGQNALSSAAPKLEKNIDRQLITFINGNIKETIADSEVFLDTALDEKVMRQVADEIWAANAASELTQVAGYLDARSLEGLVTVARDFWLHYRQTQLFHDLVAGVVHSFFRRYGKQSIAALLAEFGITQAMIVQEAYLASAPVAAKTVASGYLEESIRRRLGAFYAVYAGQ